MLLFLPWALSSAKVWSLFYPRDFLNSFFQLRKSTSHVLLVDASHKGRFPLKKKKKSCSYLEEAFKSKRGHKVYLIQAHFKCLSSFYSTPAKWR